MKRKKVLLVTVGGTAAPIVTAIEKHKPDYIYFLCSDDQPNTKFSTGTYIIVDGAGKPCKTFISSPGPSQASIVNQVGIEPSKYSIVRIPQPDNLGMCYSSSMKIIQEAKEKFPGANIIADNTGGTKTMSGALLISALDAGDVKPWLVSGERPDQVKVRDGTQRIIVSNWLPLYWHRRLKMLKSLFQGHNFVGCLQVIDDGAPNTVAGSKEDQIVQVYHSICQGFLAWDRFDHDKALQYLEPYGKGFPRHLAFLKNIIKAKPVVKDGVEKAEQSKTFSPVHDLLLNAKRRMKQGNFDDAVGRIYRALELFAQMCLAFRRPSILTGNIQPETLPEALRNRYVAPQMSISASDDSTKNKIQIGLKKAYKLIRELNDPIATLLTSSHEKTRNNLLKIRNYSIFAHGFDPINLSDAREFLHFVEQLVNDGEVIQQVCFRYENAPQFPTEVPEGIWTNFRSS